MHSSLARRRLITELKRRDFNVDYDGKREGAAAVIAVPFNCYLRGQSPDATNAAIADIASRYVRDSRPFVGQWEHASILKAHGLPVREYPHTNGDGKWVRTDRLMSWIAGEVRKLGRGTKVLVAGHPHHLPRVIALARYFDLTPVALSESKDVPYDPAVRPGHQNWCLNEHAWRRFEFGTARPTLIAMIRLSPFVPGLMG